MPKDNETPDEKIIREVLVFIEVVGEKDENLSVLVQMFLFCIIFVSFYAD